MKPLRTTMTTWPTDLVASARLGRDAAPAPSLFRRQGLSRKAQLHQSLSQFAHRGSRPSLALLPNCSTCCAPSSASATPRAMFASFRRTSRAAESDNAASASACRIPSCSSTNRRPWARTASTSKWREPCLIAARTSTSSGTTRFDQAKPNLAWDSGERLDDAIPTSLRVGFSCAGPCSSNGAR